MSAAPEGSQEQIRLHERELIIVLRASHSQLEFTIQTAGFRLVRGDYVFLASGRYWGLPVSRLIQWTVEGNEAMLIYNRGAHGIGRLRVSAHRQGWHFLWDQPTRDGFELASGKHWYGQGELINQCYPMEKISQWEAPFITWDNGPTGLGNIITPAWLASSGVMLCAEASDDHLLVGFNAAPADVPAPRWNLFEEQAPPGVRPLRATEGASGMLTLHHPARPLSYWLMVSADIREAYRHFADWAGIPAQTPPEGMMRAPIWTSWARFKMDIDQTRIVAFAEEIRAQGYPGATFEIDDKWQPHYGDLHFDPVRFPDPAAMVAKLNALGFAVTVWIIPFITEHAANMAEAQSKGYLVRQADGDPYKLTWWQGDGYLLDVSHPEALAWWKAGLEKLRISAGLAGFKFDAGEANYLPADAVTYAPISRNEYSNRWVRFAAEHFPYCEARTGWGNQSQPIFFRQWDKFSTWGHDNGLASVVTTALALSLTGYPFTMPDMIGGNAYGGVTADKELMIRWTQASAPMLCIQFSLAPWDYDAETTALCLKYADLHVALADDRIAAARAATQTGNPVIRPMFWAAPHNAEAYLIDDQYMLGDKYVVAPVLKQGATKRDLYLPPGQWQDYWSKKIHAGDQWLRNYPAPLDTLPLFVRA
jgi:myogenesis-regulating glycosidase